VLKILTKKEKKNCFFTHKYAEIYAYRISNAEIYTEIIKFRFKNHFKLLLFLRLISLVETRVPTNKEASHFTFKIWPDQRKRDQGEKERKEIF